MRYKKSANFGKSKTKSLLFAAALAFWVSGFYLPVLAAESGKKLPLPAPIIVDAPGSLEDHFGKMFVSYTDHSPEAKAFAYVEPVDRQMIARVGEWLMSFVNDTSIPAGEKVITVTFYGLGNGKVVDALIKAKQNGVQSIRIVTDLNRSLAGNFKEDQKWNFDFINAQFLEGEDALGIQRLLKAGFKFGEGYEQKRAAQKLPSQYTINSQPLYKKIDDLMIPIMHLKGIVLSRRTLNGEETVIKNIFGTANLRGDNRYNRMVEFNDPVISKEQLKHHSNQNANFAQGYEQQIDSNSTNKVGRIQDTPDQQPVRRQYKDGSFAELLFTDGRYNPNDRLIEIMDYAIAHPDRMTIKDIVMSEFVLTNASFYEKTVEVLNLNQGNNPTRLYAVGDSRFASEVTGWGLIPGYEGFMINRPMGKDVYPVRSAIREKIKVFVRQMVSDGGFVKSKEAAPEAWDLHHDKTRFLVVEEKNEDGMIREFTYGVTGSFNNSNNIANAEQSLFFKIGTKKRFVQELFQSLINYIREDSKPGGPLKSDGLAVFKTSVADFIGILETEIPDTVARDLMNDIHTKQYNAYIKKLENLATTPTTLEAKLPPEQLSVRLGRLQVVFDTYRGNIPTQMGIPKVAYAQEAIRNPVLSDGDRIQFLKSVFFVPNNVLTPPEQTKIIATVASQFGWKMQAPRPKEVVTVAEGKPLPLVAGTRGENNFGVWVPESLPGVPTAFHTPQICAFGLTPAALISQISAQ